MWPYITALIFLLFLLGILVYFIRKEAEKSARLKALKKEVREKQYAQNLISSVNAMDDNSVRDRLRKLSKK